MSTEQFKSMTRVEAERFMANAPRQVTRNRLAELVAGRQVVDLGCGKAEQVGELFLPQQYHGFDASPELVCIAQQRWPEHKFEVSTIQTIKGHWEVGIIKAVLEHVPLDEAVAIYEHAYSITDVLYVAWATEPAVSPKARSYKGELDTLLWTYRHPRSAFRWVRTREVSIEHVIWTVI